MCIRDRVCIVTNLNKTSNKVNQVSFFAIYDGHNGSGFADYMRDCFHSTLIEDPAFWQDIELAIRNTIRKVERNFHDDPMFSKDSSSVSFVIVIILGEILYYVKLGEPRGTISKNNG